MFFLMTPNFPSPKFFSGPVSSFTSQNLELTGDSLAFRVRSTYIRHTSVVRQCIFFVACPRYIPPANYAGPLSADTTAELLCHWQLAPTERHALRGHWRWNTGHAHCTCLHDLRPMCRSYSKFHRRCHLDQLVKELKNKLIVAIQTIFAMERTAQNVTRQTKFHHAPFSEEQFLRIGNKFLRVDPHGWKLFAGEYTYHRVARHISALRCCCCRRRSPPGRNGTFSQPRTANETFPNYQCAAILLGQNRMCMQDCSCGHHPSNPLSMTKFAAKTQQKINMVDLYTHRPMFWPEAMTHSLWCRHKSHQTWNAFDTNVAQYRTSRYFYLINFILLGTTFCCSLLNQDKDDEEKK